MAKTFEDRVEKVLGMLHGMAWPLLEDKDKHRIVAEVVRGMDNYGDTAAMWARALGCDRTTVARWVERFRRSEPLEDRARAAENARKRLSHARTVMKDPSVPITERVDIVKSALKDPLVRAAVQPNIDKPVDLIERAEHVLSIDEAWQAWLTRMNSVLLDGARLAERSEGERLGVYGEGAMSVYQAVTERRLDAEIRELLGA